VSSAELLSNHHFLWILIVPPPKKRRLPQLSVFRLFRECHTPALAEPTEFSLGFFGICDRRFIGQAAARYSTPTDKSADRSK
jgi:hypothetical protein